MKYLILIAFFLIFASLHSVSAGTSSDPEILDDPAQDHGGDSLDIDYAFFHNETADEFNITLQMYELPAPVSWQFNTIEYEVYFDYGNDSYAAVAVYEPGLVAFTPVNYELRKVVYTSNGTNETSMHSIDGDSSVNDAQIYWQVPKNAIGATNPEMGTPLKLNWAATYADDNLEDYANNHTDDPGRSYYFLGVKITVDNATKNGSAGDTVTYAFMLDNPGEGNYTLNISMSTSEWEISIDKASIVVMNSGDSITLTLTVNIPSNAKQGAFKGVILTFKYMLYGEMKEFTAGTTTTVASGGGGGGGGGGGKDDDDDGWLPGFEPFILVGAMLVALFLVTRRR